MSCVSVLVCSGQAAADVLTQVARVHLRLQGQPVNGAAIVDMMADAMALAIFSTLPDPSDKAMTREVMDAVSKQVRGTIKGMVKQAEVMAIRDLTEKAEGEYRP